MTQPGGHAGHGAHAHDREPGCTRSRPGRDMAVATGVSVTGVLCRNRDTVSGKKKVKQNKIFIFFVLLCVLNVKVGSCLVGLKSQFKDLLRVIA